MGLLPPFVLVVLFAVSSHGNAVESTMAGTWEARWACSKEASQNCTPDSFAVRLFVKNGSVCGTHASVVRGGNKVDELGGTEPSLIGQVVGNTATITFLSSFEGKGKAAITLTGKHLQWQIVEDDGEHWLPLNATLHRVRNTRWGSHLRCQSTE